MGTSGLISGLSADARLGCVISGRALTGRRTVTASTVVAEQLAKSAVCFVVVHASVGEGGQEAVDVGVVLGEGLGGVYAGG